MAPGTTDMMSLSTLFDVTAISSEPAGARQAMFTFDGARQRMRCISVAAPNPLQLRHALQRSMQLLVDTVTTQSRVHDIHRQVHVRTTELSQRQVDVSMLSESKLGARSESAKQSWPSTPSATADISTVDTVVSYALYAVSLPPSVAGSSRRHLGRST